MAALAGQADRTAVGLDNRFGDGKSHSSSLHAVSLVFPAVELFEDEALLGVVNSSAMVRDAGDHEIPVRFGRDRDGLFGRRVLIRVLDQVNEDFLGAG